MIDKAVRNAIAADDIRRCWAAFSYLRPHLSSVDDLIARWQTQTAKGYRIDFLEDGDDVVAAMGWRVRNEMAYGRILNVDDLVALAAVQGRGFGTALLDHAKAEARRLGCVEVQLNSGFQRHLAHRAYLRSGFVLACHHLQWTVSDE